MLSLFWHQVNNIIWLHIGEIKSKYILKHQNNNKPFVDLRLVSNMEIKNKTMLILFLFNIFFIYLMKIHTQKKKQKIYLYAEISIVNTSIGASAYAHLVYIRIFMRGINLFIIACQVWFSRLTFNLNVNRERSIMNIRVYIKVANDSRHMY